MSSEEKIVSYKNWKLYFTIDCKFLQSNYHRAIIFSEYQKPKTINYLFKKKSKKKDVSSEKRETIRLKISKLKSLKGEKSLKRNNLLV